MLLAKACIQRSGYVTRPSWCFGQAHFGRVPDSEDLGVLLKQIFEER